MTKKQMARLGIFHIQEAILSVLAEEPEGLKPELITHQQGDRHWQVYRREVQSVLCDC